MPQVLNSKFQRSVKPDNPANARHVPVIALRSVCPVSSRLVRSRPILSRPIPSCPVPSRPVLSQPSLMALWMCIPGAFFPLQPKQLSALRLFVYVVAERSPWSLCQTILETRKLFKLTVARFCVEFKPLIFPILFFFLPILSIFFLFFMHGETLIGQPLAWQEDLHFLYLCTMHCPIDSKPNNILLEPITEEKNNNISLSVHFVCM